MRQPGGHPAAASRRRRGECARPHSEPNCEERFTGHNPQLDGINLHGAIFIAAPARTRLSEPSGYCVSFEFPDLLLHYRFPSFWPAACTQLRVLDTDCPPTDRETRRVRTLDRSSRQMCIGERLRNRRLPDAASWSGSHTSTSAGCCRAIVSPTPKLCGHDCVRQASWTQERYQRRDCHLGGSRLASADPRQPFEKIPPGVSILSVFLNAMCKSSRDRCSST
jgi:hypothetical protein